MGILDWFKQTDSRTRASDYTGRNTYKKNMGTIEYYTGLLRNYLDHDDVPKEELGNGEFYYTAETVYTSNGIKKPYIITDYPMELDRGFVSDIRYRVEEYVDQYRTKTGLDGTVSVNLTVDMIPYDLRLDSRRTTNRWNGLVRMYKRVSSEMEEKSLEDELKTDRYSDNVRRKVRSFMHIRDARDKLKAGFFKTAVILELEVKNPDLVEANEILKEADRGLKAYSAEVDLNYKRLFLNVHQYYKNYTPTSMFNERELIRRRYTGNVFSDDTLSSFFMPSHGKVGDPTGLYFGIDVKSTEVVTYDLTKGTDANNLLLMAQTGQGKSAYAKMILSYVGIDPDYQTVIFDYEGTEYAPLGILLDATEIGMAGTSGSYVNTMVIQDKTGDPEIDQGRWQTAMEMTTNIYNLIFNEDYGMSKVELDIFSFLLGKMYSSAGISEDNPDKWYERSKDLTFYTLYAMLDEMINDHDPELYGNFYKEDISEFLSSLRPYFGKGQVRSSWFQNPISIEDFLNSKDVVFNFGMSNESESSVDSRKLALRQMYASYLTILKASVNKAQGIRTFVVVDEMQRYMKLRYSGSIIAQFVSGGRKLGLITLLITNSPQELISAGDSSNPNVQENVSTIIAGITGQIIGAMRYGDMDEVIEEFKLENAAGYLYELADIAENKKKKAEMKYCFYLNMRGEQTIVKGVVHPAFIESPIYSTKPISNTSGLRGADSTTQGELASDISRVQEEDRGTKDMTYREKVEKVWL